jgi:hypothetical protein
MKKLETETRQMRHESVLQFRAVMEKANADIAAELTPEQRVKFEEITKRFRERINRFRGEARERNGMGPPPDEPGPGGPKREGPDGDLPPPPPADGKDGK